jgi:hypothetical protein
LAPDGGAISPTVPVLQFGGSRLAQIGKLGSNRKKTADLVEQPKLRIAVRAHAGKTRSGNRS